MVGAQFFQWYWLNLFVEPEECKLTLFASYLLVKFQ